MAKIVNMDFGNIYDNSSTDYSLRIYRADNVVSVFLNGTQIYNRTTGGDPKLKDEVKLALKSGQNNLTIVGWNSTAKGHYHWDLFWGTYQMKDFTANDMPTKKNGVAAVYTMRIIKQNPLLKKTKG
jgi:hypothetical protein